MNVTDKESLSIHHRSNLTEIQNDHDPLTFDKDPIFLHNNHIQDKFNRIHRKISHELQNANILWHCNAISHPHIDYLPYILILKSMDTASRRLTVISNMYNSNLTSYNELNDTNIESISCYKILSNFDIGNIMNLDDIFYTKDYQKSFFHLSHSIKIAEAIECVVKKIGTPIDVNIQSTYSCISILTLLNNIIYFDISHVLIGEHELILYEYIKSLLFDKYGRTLHLLEIPTFPDSKNQISLDYSSTTQWSCVDSTLKTMTCNYLSTINNLFIHEPLTFNIDMNLVYIMETMKKHVILNSNLHKNHSIYVAVSFLTDQFHILKKHWKNNANKKDSFTGTAKSIDGIEGNQKGYEPELGGKFIIINWSSKEIVYILDLDAPAGFFIHHNHLYVANNRLNYISIIDLNANLEIRRIENRSFNCLHSIQYLQDQTILISNTGIDAIIHIDLDGEILHDWYATEHGYTLTPKGEQRCVTRDFDHHHYTYPTLHQTTHLNSAIVLNDKYFLATLFHQGSLVKIDRQSGKTNALLTELACPHGIKPVKFMKEQDIEWMLCNTKRNEVLFLNNSFVINRKMFLEDVHWLQDASQLRNGNIIIADANNSRIIEIDPILNTVISEFNYSINWRIYQISDLTDFKTSFMPTYCQ